MSFNSSWPFRSVASARPCSHYHDPLCLFRTSSCPARPIISSHKHGTKGLGLWLSTTVLPSRPEALGSTPAPSQGSLKKSDLFEIQKLKNAKWNSGWGCGLKEKSAVGLGRPSGRKYRRDSLLNTGSP